MLTGAKREAVINARMLRQSEGTGDLTDYHAS